MEKEVGSRKRMSWRIKNRASSVNLLETIKQYKMFMACAVMKGAPG
jgi:hypothetical protein